MSPVTAQQCRWHEEGGGQAAAAQCLAFLDRIGIEVDWLEAGQEAQLLDGLAIVGGRLLVDPATPVWPGDLLHEGGHIAVCDPSARPALGPIEADGGDEMASLAWSYAAALACGLPVEQLFHSGGYRGDGPWLAETFSAGHYIGAPLLGFFGMTAPDGAGPDCNQPRFPQMRHWLRQDCPTS
ncbi:MAG: hypothetical protein IE933_03720 [Sphingomonadales bacterium]|nr:hypothetical protein [Sphingomonadales bacterium]MBD3772152.1 hypothetical protein [Paracoccaceae bacterium]